MGQRPREPMKVVFLSGENPPRAVAARLRKLLSHIGADAEDLETLSENLIAPDISLREMGMYVAPTILPPDAKGELTTFGKQVRLTINEHKPDITFIDPLSDIFIGNENDRQQVSEFMNQIANMAHESQSSIVIIAHPSKSSDSEYSGSTAWNSKVRSRLLMTQEEDGTLQIEHKKHQYTPQGEDIRVMFDEGLPVEMVDEDMHMMQAMREAEIANTVFKLIRTYEIAGTPATNQPQAAEGPMKRAKSFGYSQEDLSHAITTLIETRRIDELPMDGEAYPRKKRDRDGNYIRCFVVV